MFTATAGPLPAADATEIAGIALPPGTPVVAGEGDGGAVAWISTAPIEADRLNALIRDLAGVFDRTGLWPLQAHGLGESAPDSWDGEVPGEEADDAAWNGGDLSRPWGDGELEGSAGTVGDGLEVLLRAGAANLDQERPDADPDRPAAVTALAAGTPGPDLPAAQLEVEGAGALLLVPVARPADALHALGWLGAVNYDLAGADLTAVLRTWEDRFGAVLVGIGFDSLLVQVGRRPQDPQLDAVVSEHYAFCPDNIDQGEDADAYRTGLTEWTHWSFWWD